MMHTSRENSLERWQKHMLGPLKDETLMRKKWSQLLRIMNSNNVMQVAERLTAEAKPWMNKGG